jgi:hypothetical protein
VQSESIKELNMQHDVTSAIVEFCRQHSKLTVGILVFGSYARGEQTVRSDVDVIIIDDADPVGRRVQQLVFGYPIQATIANTALLTRLLQQSRFNSNFFYPNSLADAQILLDSKGICKYLQSTAKKIQTAQPQAAPAGLIELGRVALSNFLNDGCNEKYIGSSWGEHLQWAARVVIMCHEQLLLTSGLWSCQNTALRRRQLQSHFATAYQQLNQALESFSDHRCCEQFAAETKQHMINYINFDWDTVGPAHSILN